MRTVSRAQVRQPVNVRGLGRWRTYAALLAPLMAERERAVRWTVIESAPETGPQHLLREETGHDQRYRQRRRQYRCR